MLRHSLCGEVIFCVFLSVPQCVELRSIQLPEHGSQDLRTLRQIPKAKAKAWWPAVKWSEKIELAQSLTEHIQSESESNIINMTTIKISETKANMVITII